MAEMKAALLLTCLAAMQVRGSAQAPPDALVIGAGISGLSAALEAARHGARVIVVDQSTVGGGHAILSNGAVCIIDTPSIER